MYQQTLKALKDFPAFCIIQAIIVVEALTQNTEFPCTHTSNNPSIAAHRSKGREPLHFHLLLPLLKSELWSLD